ncbi:MAG: two-component sensor histidine kinase [Acidocella sp. 20-57-95]|nr:MAG: two-component sensor histidine kinase [Acidocella sp. 20-57-95]OYV61896.1 MAG: two-component sensor histidine kinase [Acidocella sp. 21-58-7]HQT64375.1 ATP-binding protein [Acidocella sp.]HQU03707.1 ATP-binding protein [Acidocella sp.]
MRPTLLPNSLAGRTTLILLFGFALIQALGLGIHTVNQIKLARIEYLREVATQDVIIYRHVAATPANQRAASLLNEPIPRGDQITLNSLPPSHDHTTTVLPLQARQILRASIVGYGIPPAIRPRGLELRGTTNPQQYIVSFALPDEHGLNPPAPSLPPDEAAPDQPSLTPPAPPPTGGRPNSLFHPPQTWLTIITPIRPPQPWRSPEFSTAFIVMSLLGAVMIFWAVQHLLVPVRTLAQAAERLGRDVANAPDLPETGPTELVTAAMAFNTMASRIRRFVEDRTFLITAIGHDLRTPITRLKLRAEYMEDDEQRLKMLADLDEMEAMVSATLAFGRDIAASEGITLIDLPSLLRTILDDVSDGLGEPSDALKYNGPDHLAIRARPLSLKRAIINLVNNAVKYGDAALVSLVQKNAHTVQIDVEDKGPGIPASDTETVFEPFRRLETSRNRETGGSGLGLSIARNIVRAHGGDITLLNMPGGGLRARITLPI